MAVALYTSTISRYVIINSNSVNISLIPSLLLFLSCIVVLLKPVLFVLRITFEIYYFAFCWRRPFFPTLNTVN